MGKFYICNQKRCKNCSYPTCYLTTDIRYRDPNPPAELVRRLEMDSKEFLANNYKEAMFNGEA